MDSSHLSAFHAHPYNELKIAMFYRKTFRNPGSITTTYKLLVILKSISFFKHLESIVKSLARSFWAAKSNFCSIMQKYLHAEKNFLQPKNFCHLCQNSFFDTTFDIQSFWKVHKIGFKNFCMMRENFCMLQKSAPLILQPRKTPLL